jgi:HAE1 family hydrophobic/amphiphilic exporter-1
MIRYFVEHPTAANLIMVLFIVVGLVAAPSVKRETFPVIPPDEVEVRVLYPGASAEEVERTICRRIEDALEKVKDVDEVRCEARENVGTATVQMLEGSNFDRFVNEIKTEVEAIDNFPDQAEDAAIRQIGLTDFVAAVAVSGPMSPTDLKFYAEDIKDKLLATGDVSQVNVRGFSDHQIRIEVPAQTLRQFGLSVDDIAAIIARQSFDLPAGTIETTEGDILVRFDDERRNPLEFSDLVVVGSNSGAEIRLGDIAKITDMFELAESRVVFNGARAAILEISKTSNQDTLKVIGAVKTFLDEIRARAPPGVTFTITRDISSIVDDRLSLLIKNGWQGLILVMITLSLFFSVRFSFWVSMGFPVSFLGGITFMALTGLSFDMITMVGMLIGIGLLVDDAIVIAENIAAHVRQGSAPLKAALDGTKQVAPGVIASFLTTVFVFGSLAFLKGDIGSLLKFMPIILLMVLSVSLVEAFLILPHHISGSLRHASPAPPLIRRKLEAGIEWLRDVPLARIIDLAIHWRYLTLGLVIMMFLYSVSMVAGGALKFRAFPSIEGDVVEARILLPQGTPLSRTADLVARISAAITDIGKELSPSQPGGAALVKNINVRFNKNIDAFETGPHIATVTADILGTEIRTISAKDLLERWRQAVGKQTDVIALKFTEPTLGPAGRAIDIRFAGDNLEDLKAASLAMQSWLGGYTGVRDLADDLRPGKPEIRLRLKDGATSLGLTSETIARQLRAAFYGRTAGEVQVGAESYEIDVRLASADKDSLNDLEYFSVSGASGAQIPVSAVANLESGRGAARINRINGARTVTIQGDVDTDVANTAEIISDTQSHFLPKLAAKYPGISVDARGQVAEGAKTGASVRNGFLIGLVGVYLLLSFLFRNYLEPLIVMVAIPLGLIGVIWGHIFLGLDLSMPSIVGFASLAGVVVNNAILLMEFIRIQRRAGESAAAAAAHAAKMRFRAIFLTTVTTIMGLLPLLTESSLQAQVLIPLVTSIAFGLIAATALILILLPALYTIFDDFGWTAKVAEE